MIIFLLQILCSFLIAMSLVFIIIQIKAKFDKSFLIFGISNLLLCSFSAIDIWLQPTGQVLNWTRLQHVIASFFPPFLVWHIMLVLKKENISIIRIMVLISFIFSLLFLTDVMLRPSENEVISTFAYNFFFTPYILFTMVGLLVMTVFSLSKSNKIIRKTIIYYLIGELLLYIGGIFDLIIVLQGFRTFCTIPNFSIIGILAFSSTTTILFTDKLGIIVMEREITFKKLREAYRELESVQALKELGQSMAMINHEIRNYAVAISGYTEMLKMKGDLSEFSQKMADRISVSVSRMINYSKDVLEFSKSSVIKNMIQLDLLALTNACIAQNFEKEKHFFIIKNETNSDAFLIKGDWQKLDQVFINIFKNSIEANATKIIIQLQSTSSIQLCTIIDNGIGCTEGGLQNLFKAFHSTKKENGGTGLGMCVVHSIIEGHGGRISAFPRKNSEGKNSGLGLQILFPKSIEDGNLIDDSKNDVIFITDGVKHVSTIMQVFRNVFVNPHIFNSVKDINSELFKNKKMVLIGPISGIQFIGKIHTNLTIFAIVEDSNSDTFIVDEKGEFPPERFSERFILTKIIKTNVTEETLEETLI